MSAISETTVKGTLGYIWNGSINFDFEKAIYIESTQHVIYESGEVVNGPCSFWNEERLFDVLCLSIIHLPGRLRCRFYDPNDRNTKKLRDFAKKLAESKQIEISQKVLEKLLKTNEKIKQISTTLLEHKPEEVVDFWRKKIKREYYLKTLFEPYDSDENTLCFSDEASSDDSQDEDSLDGSQNEDSLGDPLDDTEEFQLLCVPNEIKTGGSTGNSDNPLSVNENDEKR